MAHISEKTSLARVFRPSAVQKNRAAEKQRPHGTAKLVRRRSPPPERNSPGTRREREAVHLGTRHRRLELDASCTHSTHTAAQSPPQEAHATCSGCTSARPKPARTLAARLNTKELGAYIRPFDSRSPSAGGATTAESARRTEAPTSFLERTRAMAEANRTLIHRETMKLAPANNAGTRPHRPLTELHLPCLHRQRKRRREGHTTRSVGSAARHVSATRSHVELEPSRRAPHHQAPDK